MIAACSVRAASGVAEGIGVSVSVGWTVSVATIDAAATAEPSAVGVIELLPSYPPLSTMIENNTKTATRTISAPIINWFLRRSRARWALIDLIRSGL